MNDLNKRLLAAHTTDDRRALVKLYAEAAEAANDLDAACKIIAGTARSMGIEVG